MSVQDRGKVYVSLLKKFVSNSGKNDEFHDRRPPLARCGSLLAKLNPPTVHPKRDIGAHRLQDISGPA